MMEKAKPECGRPLSNCHGLQNSRSLVAKHFNLEHKEGRDERGEIFIVLCHVMFPFKYLFTDLGGTKYHKVITRKYHGTINSTCGKCFKNLTVKGKVLEFVHT